MEAEDDGLVTLVTVERRTEVKTVVEYFEAEEEEEGCKRGLQPQFNRTTL